MSALGFGQFKQRWLFQGEVCEVSFYLGFADGMDTGEESNIILVGEAIQTIWDDGLVINFNRTRLSAMHLPTTTFLGFTAYVKGGIGIESLQFPTTAPTAGSRTVLEGEQMMPPENTVSCYAKRYLRRGRGAKVGFTGATEGDWDGTRWTDSLNSFYFLVRQYVQGWPTFVQAVATETGLSLFPAVVPRIPSTSPAGNPTSRLPDRINDSAVTFQIAPYEPSRRTGSADTRQLPLR